MIFERKKGVRFGSNDKLFLSERFYIFRSKINTLIDLEGYMGPVNCGSISSNKKLSIIKGFSESVERRAIAFGAKKLKETPDYASAYNFVNNEMATIPISQTKYRRYPPYIDTTGSAAHSNANQSINTAITELLEKNAVFLLWYGMVGTRIKSSVPSPYKEYLEKQGYEITHFLIDYFKPLKVVVTVSYSESTYLKYKFGVGSSIDIMEAIEKSLSEACQIGTFYESILFNQKFGFYDNELDELLSWNEDENTLEYLKELKRLPYTPHEYKDINSNRIDIGLLKEMIPDWVNELLVFVLPQKIKSELLVVKTYSEQLYNHIPKKQYIDLNKPINKQTIDLNLVDLKRIPDCPIS